MMMSEPTLAERLRERAKETERVERVRIWEATHRDLLALAADRIEELEAFKQEYTDNPIIERQGEIIREREQRIAELEEKTIFAERWITQTCETGQITAVRNQYIGEGPEWILSVAIPPENDDE